MTSTKVGVFHTQWCLDLTLGSELKKGSLLEGLREAQHCQGLHLDGHMQGKHLTSYIIFSSLKKDIAHAFNNGCDNPHITT